VKVFSPDKERDTIRVFCNSILTDCYIDHRLKKKPKGMRVNALELDGQPPGDKKAGIQA
jgi:hypothetical protein